MLNIEIVPNSLLYGESYFWMALSAFAPMHLAPNFRITRTEHAVKLLPKSASIMGWHTRVSENQIFKAIFAQLFSLFQSLYLLTYVVVGVAFEGEILASLSIPRSQTLTYKILVETPTAFRLGLLVITLINMRDLNYRVWHLYDRNDMFSVARAHQARVASWCLVSLVPDAMANVIETLHIVYFMHMSNILAGALRDRFAITLTMYIVFSGLINIMLRYKPVLNLTYTATCVSEHLEFVNSQIVITTRASLMIENRHILIQREPPPPPPPPGVSDHHHHLFTIRNLHELERHLTRVQLFISDLDRESPTSILTLTAINTMTFFYTICYTSYHTDLVTITGALLLCGARSLPLVAMFVAGSRLERICRQMNDKLEAIYFQGESHSLIYKQMASSHLSLARALRTLGEIRLTCNELMCVNMRTLRKCAIYVGTVMLIVAQYDSLAGTNSNYRPAREVVRSPIGDN